MARARDRGDACRLPKTGGEKRRSRSAGLLGRLHRDSGGARDSWAQDLPRSRRRAVRLARLPQRFAGRHRNAGAPYLSRTCRLAAAVISAPVREERIMARVAIVTGGTRGIGEAISIMLNGMGVKVAANYAGNEERAREFSERTGIASYKWDVADFDACQEGVGRVEAELGPIDVLVNNAGITRDATMKRMTRQMWDEVIDVNLGGCFNMAKAVFEGMQGRKFGRIVNIGSINGQAGQYGQVNYAAAKSGIHGFTKALAQEGARAGVTVNAIAPGYIDTEMVAAVPEDVLAKIVARIPVGRLGKAEEIARGVVFLCGDDAGFVTGSTLSINGGQHMY